MVFPAGPPPPNFLYDPSFSNNIVQAEYAGYSAYVDDLVRDTYGGSVTNLPGITISAGNLNLTRTVITNQGSEVVIKATHLISSTNAVITSQYLSYNLGSTNGYLNVTNLVNSSPLPGFNGTLSAFSALWTNTMITIVATNYATNTIPPTPTPLTNFTEMDFHVLIVDASGLSSTVAGGTVQDLILHSTNMVVSDPMEVMHTLLFDGQRLTLLEDLYLYGDLQNWTCANAPALRYFTNNGTLFILQNAHFGDDGPTNYASFVNNGIIYAYYGGMTINSDYFTNSGTLYATGGVFVTTSLGKVANASIISGRDVAFTGGTLGLTNSTITIGNHLYFNVTNKLYDGGPSSFGNSLTCENGFSLLSEPTNGDFLDTTITSETTNRAEIDHVWAGEDRKDTAAGFSNNVAIGTLILSDLGTPTTVLEEPLFVLSGTSTTPGVTNGLYVYNLDLSGLVDSDNEVEVSDNLLIYYINVVGAIPAPYASQFVHSSVIVPQGYVPNPFTPSPQLSASAVGSGQQFQLTVNGVAGQTYIVEASTNLSAGNWVNISTNTAPATNGPFLLQFVDPRASPYPTRFYRVVPQ